MSKKAIAGDRLSPEAIDETLEAIRDLKQLNRVLRFLAENGGDEDMRHALERVIEDTKSWIDPEIEVAFVDNSSGRFS